MLECQCGVSEEDSQLRYPFYYLRPKDVLEIMSRRCGRRGWEWDQARDEEWGLIITCFAGIQVDVIGDFKLVVVLQ